MSFCFFFQAEDGIRDYKVTGVQTCALPISRGRARGRAARGRGGVRVAGAPARRPAGGDVSASKANTDRERKPLNSSHLVISYAPFFLEKKKNKAADHTFDSRDMFSRRSPLTAS